MKLFGKDLFGFKKEPKKLYDFAQHGLVSNFDFVPQEAFMTTTAMEVAGEKKGEKAKKVKEVKKLSPKELHQMKALNENDFRIRTSKAYLKEQLEIIDAKLDLFGKKPKKQKNRFGEITDGFEFGAKAYGREELESIKERLNNRYRLGEFKDVVEKYPHTSTQLVMKLIKENNHLRAQEASSFVPDFPKDAIQAMKEYEDFCVKLCDKTPVFYVIAKSEDFQKVAKRRDPILLAQSPFGHFWQILGAWDEEMIYLGDL